MDTNTGLICPVQLIPYGQATVAAGLPGAARRRTG